MKKLKFLSMSMALMLGMGCISGCGANEKASTGDVTTISIWSTDSHSKTILDRLTNDYNNNQGKTDGIKIEYKVIDGDTYSKNLDLALQSGQGPDIFQAGAEKSKIDNNYIASIGDISGGEDFANECLQKYPNSTISYNGKVYCLPTGVTTRGLIYNKDMFKEAGIVDENGEPKPPETFEEMRETAKQLTNKSKNQFGMIFPEKWSGWIDSDIMSPLLECVGHVGFDPVTGEFDYSGAAPILDAYLGMIDDGSVYPGADGIDNDTARAFFSEGLIGMKIGYSFDVGVLNDQFPAKCDWGVAPLPVTDKNNRYRQPMTMATTFAINQASVESKGGDKLLKVMQWLISEDMAKELYKEGATLPYDEKIVEEVKLENPKTGWQEFADMIKISSIANDKPSRDMTGYLSLDERIRTQVLSRESSPAEALEQFNKDCKAASEKYYSLHTDESFEKYLDKDWNIKLNN